MSPRRGPDWEWVWRGAVGGAGSRVHTSVRLAGWLAEWTGGLNEAPERFATLPYAARSFHSSGRRRQGNVVAMSFKISSASLAQYLTRLQANATVM